MSHLPTAPYLAPGQVSSFYDSHPYVNYMDARGLTVVYTDEDGTEYAARFRIALSMEQYHPELETIYPDYSHDNGKDGAALRHDASFSVQVAEGVYWVPANSLGASRYTNAQIQAMLTDTPEQKQAKIGTLYEALQLYQIGGFYAIHSNVHRAASLEAFTQYLVDADDYTPVELVYAYTAENAPSLASVWSPAGTQLCFSDNVAVRILYDNPNDTLTTATLPAPGEPTTWGINEDFAFDKMQFQ